MSRTTTSENNTVQRLLDFYVADRDRKIADSKKALIVSDREFHESSAEAYAWVIDRILTLLDEGTPESEIVMALLREIGPQVDKVRAWGVIFPKDNFYYGKISGYQDIAHTARTFR